MKKALLEAAGFDVIDRVDRVVWLREMGRWREERDCDIFWCVFLLTWELLPTWQLKNTYLMTPKENGFHNESKSKLFLANYKRIQHLTKYNNKKSLPFRTIHISTSHLHNNPTQLQKWARRSNQSCINLTRRNRKATRMKWRQSWSNWLKTKTKTRRPTRTSQRSLKWTRKTRRSGNNKRTKSSLLSKSSKNFSKHKGSITTL